MSTTALPRPLTFDRSEMLRSLALLNDVLDTRKDARRLFNALLDVGRAEPHWLWVAGASALDSAGDRIIHLTPTALLREFLAAFGAGQQWEVRLLLQAKV